jgi:hypothetical protein
MKVAINIISSAKIMASHKIDNLDEKRLVPNMMTRRRLTRNAKVMLYLADKCTFEDKKIVYGSCYSELQETSSIAHSVANTSQLSPTSFQNSVYNTAPSYYSLIHKNKDEIITVSSGMKTSLDTLKTAALQALVSKEKVLCICVECLNIKNIEEVNSCTTYLEAGAAVVLEIAENGNDAVELDKLRIDGVIESLGDLMSAVNMHENGKNKILIEL